MDLPSLFDSCGVFKPLPDNLIGTLDEAHAAAYEKIRECAFVLAAADNKLALAMDTIKDRVVAVTDFDQWMRKTFPKMTFHDLWKANFSRN